MAIYRSRGMHPKVSRGLGCSSFTMSVFLFLGDLVLGIEPGAHTDLSYNSRQSKHLNLTPLTTPRLCAMGSKHCSALSRRELVRRSKFPYKPPMGSTPSGVSFCIHGGILHYSSCRPTNSRFPYELLLCSHPRYLTLCHYKRWHSFFVRPYRLVFTLEF